MTALAAAVRGRPRLAALLGAFCISLSGILYRAAAVDPTTGVIFRCLYALPLLGLVAWQEQRSLGSLGPRDRRLAALAGVLFAVDLLTYHYVIDNIGAGLATVVANLQVVFVALGAWIAWGERPRPQVLLALPVIFAGVVLISGVLGGPVYGTDAPTGVALALVTAITYAGYLLIIRRTTDERRPAGPVTIAVAVSALIGVGYGAVSGTGDLVPSVPAHLFLVPLGLVSQGLGYLFIQTSLPRLPAVLTSVILLVQPVTTVVLGALLLAEAPSVAQVAGVALVVGGIALATARRAGPAGRSARTRGAVA